MTHVVVGYPTLALTDVIIDALVAGGSHYIELQIPFSDPLADGPLIMHASDVALSQGVTIEDVYQKAAQYTRAYPAVKFLFVLYANTLVSCGITAFCKKAKECGIYGLIVPDLPFDTPEGVTLTNASDDERLALVPVIAPSTTDKRMMKICSHHHELIYASSYMGVTGEFSKWDHLSTYIIRIRKYSDAQIAVGFGIKNREDVKTVHKSADIAVVGSEVVRFIKTHQTNITSLLMYLKTFTQSLLS